MCEISDYTPKSVILKKSKQLMNTCSSKRPVYNDIIQFLPKNIVTFFQTENAATGSSKGLPLKGPECQFTKSYLGSLSNVSHKGLPYR